MRSVKRVIPLENYRLQLHFDNGEIGIFDMTPYLDMGRFKELRDHKIFDQVHVVFDSVAWPNGVDIDPENLYASSKIISTQEKEAS